MEYKYEITATRTMEATILAIAPDDLEGLPRKGWKHQNAAVIQHPILAAHLDDEEALRQVQNNFMADLEDEATGWGFDMDKGEFYEKFLPKLTRPIQRISAALASGDLWFDGEAYIWIQLQEGGNYGPR